MDYLQKAARVKLLVIGVDGVLTDAGMYFSDRGDVYRKFNRRDAMGIQLLKETNITVALVSSIQSPIVQSWANTFGIDHVYLGVRDKFHTIENLCTRCGISLDQASYISDDVDELHILEQVGFPVTVADGTEANKNTSAYVTNCYGGQGAVREVIELILSVQGKGAYA
jgi:3-deoxy-D-manno-octulosonate 8-phosphate phosphatase (KDO 8-P phosphatase)